MTRVQKTSIIGGGPANAVVWPFDRNRECLSASAAAIRKNPSQAPCLGRAIRSIWMNHEVHPQKVTKPTLQRMKARFIDWAGRIASVTPGGVVR